MREGLRISPMTGDVGAVVHDVDLVDGLRPDVVAALLTSLADYGVLFFPPPPEGERALLSLAASLGDIVMPHAALASRAEAGRPEISEISTGAGNAAYAGVWHTDVSWKAAPSRFSIMHLVEAPAAGGDTMWSSQVAAYRALSPVVQELAVTLTATHECMGQTVTHPLVIRHPLSGAEALFVNGLFTRRVNELTEAESAALLAFLAHHTTRPEFVCRKRWTGGEVALWDNHFVQHYAVQDYRGEARTVHRVEVRPEAPIPSRPMSHADRRAQTAKSGSPG